MRIKDIWLSKFASYPDHNVKNKSDRPKPLDKKKIQASIKERLAKNDKYRYDQGYKLPETLRPLNGDRH